MLHSVTMSARRQPQKASACPSARRTGGTTSAAPPVRPPAFRRLRQSNNAPASVRDTLKTQNAVTLRHQSQQREDQPGDQSLQPKDQELQRGEHKPLHRDQVIPQQEDPPGLDLQRLGKHQDQQQQGKLQDHQDQGPRLGGPLLHKHLAHCQSRLQFAHMTVLKPSETERLWRSVSSTKERLTTATTRSARRNAEPPPAEGKRIRTVGSTWATRSVTLLHPLARLSAKRMRHSGFAPPNAKSLKATLTAAPLSVLPSVQTNEGVSAARA